MMKKSGLKITSKVLTGLVLLTGITSIPTNAVEVKNAAVDVNAKDVKVSVYENGGHYFAKLVSEKEVANVVARIVVDGKAEFSVKKDLIKAGEVVEYELDINAPVPTKKLPHTAVKKETVKASAEIKGHKFNITVRYEVATDEVKAQQTENKKIKEQAENTAKETEVKKEESKVLSSAEETKATASETTVAAATKEEKAPETVATTVTPTTASAPVTASTTAVRSSGFRSVGVSAPKEKTVMASTTAVSTTNKQTAPVTATVNKQTAPATTQKTTQTTNQAPAVTPTTTSAAATPAVGTREEQIRQAFLAKVNQLRALNKLAPLSQNASLNASAKARANTVIGSPLTASVHGKAGSLEKAAAAQTGYANANHILYNVAVNTNSGTPEQVAQRLIDALYHEINNVTTTFPYGHRNTLLNATSTEMGVGVTIAGDKVSLVQHVNNSGAFNGKKAISSVYLDGKKY